MSSNENQFQFSFNWRIENFSSCIQKLGESIFSPIFEVQSLYRSKWKLALYPKGDKTSDYISCYLLNVDMNTAKIDTEFKFEFAGRYLYNKIFQVYDFGKGSGYGLDKFLSHEVLYREKENLPNDTLTIICHMKTKTENKLGMEACSKIGVDTFFCLWKVKNPNSSNWTQIKLFGKIGGFVLKVILSCPENDILINIKLLNHVQFSTKFIKCKISLIDAQGVERKSISESHLFDSVDDQWQFPNFITKCYIQDKNHKLLKNLIFSLFFEFSVSHGIITETVDGVTEYKILSSEYCYTNEFASALEEDFRDLKISKKNSDVKIKIDETEILDNTPNELVPATRSFEFLATSNYKMMKSQSNNTSNILATSSPEMMKNQSNINNPSKILATSNYETIKSQSNINNPSKLFDPSDQEMMKNQKSLLRPISLSNILATPNYETMKSHSNIINPSNIIYPSKHKTVKSQSNNPSNILATSSAEIMKNQSNINNPSKILTTSNYETMKSQSNINNPSKLFDPSDQEMIKNQISLLRPIRNTTSNTTSNFETMKTQSNINNPSKILSTSSFETMKSQSNINNPSKLFDPSDQEMMKNQISLPRPISLSNILASSNYETTKSQSNINNSSNIIYPSKHKTMKSQSNINNPSKIFSTSNQKMIKNMSNNASNVPATTKHEKIKRQSNINSPSKIFDPSNQEMMKNQISLLRPISQSETMKSQSNIYNSPNVLATSNQETINNQSNINNVRDSNSDALKDFLNFFNTGSVGNLDYESTLKLLIAADKYQMLPLIEKCSAHLMSTISVKNVCKTLKVADMISHNNLKAFAIVFIKQHSKEILNSPEWCQWIEINTKLGIEILREISNYFSA